MNLYSYNPINYVIKFANRQYIREQILNQLDFNVRSFNDSNNREMHYNGWVMTNHSIMSDTSYFNELE